jgi:hypothetical protein
VISFRPSIENFVLSDGEEGLGAFYALAIMGTSADALAEVTKLV